MLKHHHFDKREQLPANQRFVLSCHLQLRDYGVSRHINVNGSRHSADMSLNLSQKNRHLDCVKLQQVWQTGRIASRKTKKERGLSFAVVAKDQTYH